MQRNAIESIVSALVLVAAIAFLVFSYRRVAPDESHGYTLTAAFSEVGGLQAGAEVRASGVRIGQVANVGLDPQTYLAALTLVINSNVRLPVDSVATVSSDGFGAGSPYLELLPGTSRSVLAPGQRITRTQSPMSIEQQLGNAVFNLQNFNTGKGGPPQPSSPAHP